jgi:hypothetical protein
MKQQEFEKLHGKLGDNITYIDLDEQQELPEPTTCGWTDTQIRNKSLEEFDAMISSGDMGIASLKQTLNNEVQRIDDLRRVRNRKTDL